MRHQQKTLILGKRDVARLINLRGSIKAVEKAFGAYALDKAHMPAKIYLDLPEYSGDFRAMPAYLEKERLCSLKWVNSHSRNKKYQLPAVMGVVILSDPRNGFPLCVMDGTLLTCVRTAAAGAVAAKHLAQQPVETLGLVGCGQQAIWQLQGLRELFRIKRIHVWGHQAAVVKSFLNAQKKSVEEIVPVKSIAACVKEVDVIVTTTPSRKPLVKRSWVKDGAHINAIGADAVGKQELDPKILKESRVIVDDWAQASHSGEINVPLKKGQISKRNIYANLGEVIAGKRKGRTSDHQITVFDSTGLAIQDTATANLIYKKALREKVGHKAVFV